MKDLFKKIQPLLPYLIALLSGCIYPYAFAPYSIGIVGLVSPGILLWCISKKSVSKGFILGLLYGLGLFGLGTNWVYVSIHDYGDAPPLLAGFLTSLFILVLALFPAFLAATLNRFFPTNNNSRCLLAFPALWVLFEILRGWIFTGFPWLYLGYSQINNHLSALAPIGSVWAVSWVSALIGGILYEIFDYFYAFKQNKALRNKLFLALFAILAVAFGASKFNWTTPTGKTLTVALVQGNIPQEIKWEPEKLDHILEAYQKLTQQVLSATPKTSLIVWPEGAIPASVQSAVKFIQQIDGEMESKKTGLITGIPWQTPSGQYYNSLIGFGFATTGVYHKTHLVPFGEYVPFEKWLRGLIAFFDLPMSDFIPGPKEQKLISSFNFIIAPAICYEIAYPTFVQKISKDADLILTISNDTWFGTSIGPAQHLEIARFRALETQKYIMRATNTGFTVIIEPDGGLQGIANQFEPAILYGTVEKMQGQTFWVRYGLWPLLASLIAVLGLAFLFNKKKK